MAEPGKKELQRAIIGRSGLFPEKRGDGGEELLT
jgi:hypothetical protein